MCTLALTSFHFLPFEEHLTSARYPLSRSKNQNAPMAKSCESFLACGNRGSGSNMNVRAECSAAPLLLEVDDDGLIRVMGFLWPGGGGSGFAEWPPSTHPDRHTQTHTWWWASKINNTHAFSCEACLNSTTFYPTKIACIRFNFCPWALENFFV